MKKFLLIAVLAIANNYTLIFSEAFSGGSVAISLVNNTFDTINLDKNELKLNLNTVITPQNPLYNCICTDTFESVASCSEENTILFQPLNSSILATDTTRFGGSKTTPYYYIPTNNTCTNAVITAELSVNSGSKSIPLSTINMGFTKAAPNNKWYVESMPINLDDAKYDVTVTPTACPSNAFLLYGTECFEINVTKAKRTWDTQAHQNVQEQLAHVPPQPKNAYVARRASTWGKR